MAPITTRPPGDIHDQNAVRALLGDLEPQRAILILAEEAGLITGAATWLEPDAGPALLGNVVTTNNDRRTFYQLIRRCAQDAIDSSHDEATFTLTDHALLALVETQFTTAPEITGTDPATGAPTAWRVTVDLRDAIRQLDRAIALLEDPTRA